MEIRSRMINDRKGCAVEAVLGCADSSVVVSGANYGGSYYLTRFNKWGTFLWQHNYATVAGPLNFVKLAEDDRSDFYGLSFWSSASTGPFKLVKFDGSGNVVWTGSYNFYVLPADFTAASGLTVVNGQVYVSGSAYFSGTNGWAGTT